MTRLGLVTATALAAIGVGYPGLAPMPTKLIWNASASAPIGLYTVAPADRVEVPELVAVDPPGVLAAFLDARGYVPEVGVALERDHSGRDLPVWQGCERVPAGAVFLMNWQVRDSLDGRYFGLTPTRQIIGRAVPLWTDEGGDGWFQWRATTR